MFVLRLTVISEPCALSPKARTCMLLHYDAKSFAFKQLARISHHLSTAATQWRTLPIAASLRTMVRNAG